MSDITILVIDDSATIRRLVDSELSVEGYRIVLAPNAEDGIQLAGDESPDLILLDHQLPGTTGYEVACKLLEHENLRYIPVVISSTLRKKAYAEYTELTNVVDMLPKPYTPDLLRTTVANALDTASMIVQSQSEGTAVPEVIGELGDADLSGTFATFGLREVLDFLNNSSKCGQLEVEAGRTRVCVFLDKGRIQAVTATGVDPSVVANSLPENLNELAPMVKFTVGGRNCSEIDGLVELLDNKVLDARLLKQLLRHQAAVLLKHCFETKELGGFRFESDRIAPSLFRKLPLDMSLLALLVESSLLWDEDKLPEFKENEHYSRNPIRGQNLDRAGLSGKHMKMLGLVNKPVRPTDVAAQTQCSEDEVRRVMFGFEMAELVCREEKTLLQEVVAVVQDEGRAQHVNDYFARNRQAISGKVVNDPLSVRLLLRRSRPEVILVDLDAENAGQLVEQIRNQNANQLNGVRWVGLTNNENGHCDFVNDVYQWPADEHQWHAVWQGGQPDGQEHDNHEPENSEEVVDCL